MKVLKTRLVTADATLVERAADFVNRLKHPDVLPRETEEYRQAAERSRLFVVLDDQKDEVAAVSSVFDLDGIWSGKSILELGSTLVAEGYRGYRLQPLLFAARLASIACTEIDPESGQSGIVPISLAKPHNQNSKKSIERAGFLFMEEERVPGEVFIPCVGCPKKTAAEEAGRICCCDVYQELELPKWRATTSLLATGGSTISLQHRSDGSQLDVDLTSFFSPALPRQAIEEFAAGVWP